MKNPDHFDIPGLAKYLGLAQETIYKHAKRGLIPGFKVGVLWRFRKTTIDKWIDEKEKEALIKS